MTDPTREAHATDSLFDRRAAARTVEGHLAEHARFVRDKYPPVPACLPAASNPRVGVD